MKRVVTNWTDAQTLIVAPNDPHGDIPPLVNIICDGGALRLQFGMTPEQARGMAAVLMASADECETAKEAA